jgi:tetratricopeptide (TPR) repeat protein
LTHEARNLAEERLATLYSHLLAEQAAAFDRATPQKAIDIVGRELDNVHQAWQWAAMQERYDLLLQSIDGLGEYYAATGRNVEGEERFAPVAQRLLNHHRAADAAEQLLCQHLLNKLCHCLIWRSKLAEALVTAQTLTELAQTTANHEFVARGLVYWGKTLLELGNNGDAERRLQTALTLARQLAQPCLIGHVLIESSHVFRRSANQYKRAMPCDICVRWSACWTTWNWPKPMGEQRSRLRLTIIYQMTKIYQMTNAKVATAHTQLQTNASKMTDQQLLQTFWQAPPHRKLRELWRQSRSI